MYNYKCVLFILLWIEVISNYALEENSYCETPLKEEGTCINIESCDSVKQFLSNRHRSREANNYLNQLTCGFIGTKPLVCCPRKLDNTSLSNTSERESRMHHTTPPVITSSKSSTDSIEPVTASSPQIQLTTNINFRQNVTNKLQIQPDNAVFLRPPDCGSTTFTGGLRVVGGVPAKLGNFPWMVALGYRNRKNPDLPKWLCGGTLITKRHVLTAAHCIETTEELYTVRIGDLDLYSDDDGATPLNILVASTKVHEGYNPQKELSNDIGILTLSEDVKSTTIWPICLPVDESLRNNTFVRYFPFVAGWGSQRFKGPSSNILLGARLTVFDNEECKIRFAEFKRATIDDRCICAGFSQGGKDSCKGDSGAPLMLPIAEGGVFRFYIIGIVSYGYGCGEPGYPGIYTRVTHFIEWIRNNIQN